jgi:hypothetical protein
MYLLSYLRENIIDSRTIASISKVYPVAHQMATYDMSLFIMVLI